MIGAQEFREPLEGLLELRERGGVVSGSHVHAAEVRERAPDGLRVAYVVHVGTRYALRLIEGFPLALYQERTGLPLSTVMKEIEDGERQGLLSRDLKSVRPTERGRLFLNELMALFVGERSTGRGSGVRVSGPATRTS